jgi:ribosomal protein S18 acetylase RimI-like enzyme
MAIQIAPFELGSRVFEEAADVYCAVFGGEWEGGYLFMMRYAQYPDFHGRVALNGSRVVGMGFGTRSEPGQWWHDRVASQVGVDHPALQDAWVLVELGILEDYRSQGIGGRLHDALIAAHPLPHLLLSTQVDNLGAQRFYTRRGWQILHPGFAFLAGSPPYLVMHQTLSRDTG